MEDIVLNGVELNVFKNGHNFFAVNVDLYSEDFGSVDEFANSFVGYNQVCGDEAFAVADLNHLLTGLESAVKGKINDFATVENKGNHTF